ncbi:MAG: hypothetical protein OXB88_07470 [Bacteriovoracales bacterium]|nr:hypothetical protein [Bacteriovoracales bacterium]
MEQLRFNFYRKNRDSYCPHSLCALHFIDNNLPPKDRKAYLTHLEDCTACSHHIQSLRKDLSDIEKMIPSISKNNQMIEDYSQRIKTLADDILSFRRYRLSDLLNIRFSFKGIKKFYQSLIMKLE